MFRSKREERGEGEHAYIDEQDKAGDKEGYSHQVGKGGWGWLQGGDLLGHWWGR